MPIRVAIIDSGVDFDHPRLRGAKVSGISLPGQNGLDVTLNDEFMDETGHGTSCAAIVHQTCPEAEIVAVKVVFEDRPTDEKTLCKGLQWVLDQGDIDIVNISMGVETSSPHPELFTACERAKEKGLHIVAATSNEPGVETYPAWFPNVYGVTGGNIKKSRDYYYLEGAPVEWMGKGGTQRVAILGGKFTITSGTSYAAAHISGIIALALAEGRASDVEAMREYLIKKRNRGILPEYVSTPKGEKTFLPTVCPSNLEKIGRKLFSKIGRLDWAGRIAIFPSSEKEMKPISTFAHLCKYNIATYIDYPRSIKIGFKDTTNEIVDRQYSNVSSDLMDSFETLVTGYYAMHKFDANVRFGHRLVERCIKNFKNMIFWDRTVREYAKERLNALGVPKANWYIPKVNREDFEEVLKFRYLKRVSVPVLLVVGTSNKQGKFTTQLRVLELLQKKGYEVGFVSTEPQGEFFGASFVFPYGYNSTVNIRSQSWGTYLRVAMRGIQQFSEPDLILTGTQSKVLPRTCTSNELSNPALLDSLHYIAAVEPDAIICAINPQDSFDLIENTIRTAGAFCRGKTIMLAMTPWFRDFETDKKGRSMYKSRLLDAEELEDRMTRVSERLELPVINVMENKNSDLIVKAIITAFS